MTTRSGMTLLELILALALSLVVASAGFAALRTCTSIITAINRLSLENRLFRLGFFAALDEVDYWASYDDPYDPGMQQMRTVNGGTGDFVDPRGQPSAGANGRPFVALEFTADVWRWDLSDPRSWWRGCGQNQTGTYGHYREFARIGHPDGGSEPYRAWLPEHQDRLFNLLGIYGMVDYLPANQPYGYYRSPTGRNSFGDPVAELADDLALKPWQACNADPSLGQGSDDMGSALRARGRLGIRLCAIAPQAERRSGSDLVDEWIDRAAQRRLFQGVGDGAWRWERRLHNLRSRSPLTDDLPVRWPQLDIGVSHYWFFNNAYNIVQLGLINTTDGEIRQLTFGCLGTTLRGARMQRGLDRSL